MMKKQNNGKFLKKEVIGILGKNQNEKSARTSATYTIGTSH